MFPQTTNCKVTCKDETNQNQQKMDRFGWNSMVSREASLDDLDISSGWFNILQVTKPQHASRKQYRLDGNVSSELVFMFSSFIVVVCYNKITIK